MACVPHDAWYQAAVSWNELECEQAVDEVGLLWGDEVVEECVHLRQKYQGDRIEGRDDEHVEFVG